MARIAYKPIPLPAGVTVTVTGSTVRVQGPKGEFAQELLEGLKAEVESGILRVFPKEGVRVAPRVLSVRHGLARKLLKNMVEGAVKGFEKKLEIRGVGYRAAVEKGHLHLTVGFSHPVSYPIPKGITIEVEKQTLLTIKGVDKWLVGETAATIRRLKPPEVYKGTGIRYQGEVVRQKAGKAGAAK